MRVSSHSTALPYEFSIPCHWPSLATFDAKSHQITIKNCQKKSNYLSTTPFHFVFCENTLFFKISLCRYSWSKTPLKREKWLRLLVDFGPPGSYNQWATFRNDEILVKPLYLFMSLIPLWISVLLEYDSLTSVIMV